MRDVIGYEDTHRYLIHDRDSIFARHLETKDDCNYTNASCSSGVALPADNRSAAEVNKGQCKFVCQISSFVPVAICNAFAGGGVPGAVGGTVAKAGLCSLICN